ncbi:MAG: hypothetical protein WC378_18465 [Opitutaceae bacterium]|jgi:hypothetical protein
MRSACAVMRFFYHHVMGKDWNLFDLVRCPNRKKLPDGFKPGGGATAARLGARSAVPDGASTDLRVRVADRRSGGFDPE